MGIFWEGLLLRKLLEVQFELLWRINALLYKQRIHGIDRGAEAVIAGKLFHCIFKADESSVLAGISDGTVAIVPPNLEYFA